MFQHARSTFGGVAAVAAALSLLSSPLSSRADTVTWANWSSASAGAPGTASATIALGSGIAVNYSGQINGLSTNYPSWAPSGTFSGGTVGNAPPASNNAVAMTGGGSYTETITFSSAIVNPVMAIWSLGQAGDTASFNFNSLEPFTIQAGGASSEYGGSSIYQTGNSIFGTEGNGVIQFTGTFNSLTFTTPVYENYYAFTVGADALPAPIAATPEPGTLSLLGIGIASIPMLRRKLLTYRR